MKDVKRISFKALFVGTFLIVTAACSNVHFDDSSNGKLQVVTGPQSDMFDFNDAGAMTKVDILIVDDNSGSMLTRQQKMAARMGPFVDTLGNVDWQIGITTTDTSTGPYGLRGSFVDLNGAPGKVLNRDTPNFETVFTNTIVRQEIISCGAGPCPSDDERPLQAINQAIAKRNTDNAGFFRPDASLAVIILSDEDESFASDGAPVPAQSVIDTVHAAFGPNKIFNAYGIITKPGDESCINQGERHASLFIDELISLTGGVAGNICENDYISSLTAIGESVNTNSAVRTLRALPVPNSVQIEVQPFDPELQYHIEGQQIKFNRMPKKGTRVTVKYVAVGHE